MLRKFRYDRDRKIKAAQAREKNYGLTPEKFERMLGEQRNCCAICGKEFEDTRYQGPCVDHVHDESKRVRELLCQHCNRLLGHAFDSIVILQSAIRYLIKHQETQGGDMTQEQHIKYDFNALSNLEFRAKYRITMDAYALIEDAFAKSAIGVYPKIDIVDGFVTIG